MEYTGRAKLFFGIVTLEAPKCKSKSSWTDSEINHIKLYEECYYTYNGKKCTQEVDTIDIYLCTGNIRFPYQLGSHKIESQG